VPTEAGTRLLAHARGIVQQVERARQDVEEVKGAPVGHVTIALPPTLARLSAAPLVLAFRSRFPRATISIVEGLSTAILEWVQLGRVDVGIAYNPSPSPAIDLVPLVEEELCLIGVRKGAREPASVALRDLPRYPLIIPARPHALRTLIEARLAALGLRPNVTLEIDAIAAILELVAEGMGYAILTPRALQGESAARRLRARPIVKPRLASTLAIALSAHRPVTPLQAASVQLVTEVVGAGRKT
jgi:LysR family nitrogen assimilation transcriptional regulator